MVLMEKKKVQTLRMPGVILKIVDSEDEDPHFVNTLIQGKVGKQDFVNETKRTLKFHKEP